jgi:hypothetical protein
MPQDKYLPVNWMDGMKINKSHFIAENNASVYQLAQTVSSLLNNYNYGLLPCKSDSANAAVFVSADNQQQVQVRLQKCMAVTRGGYMICFDESDNEHNRLSASIPDLSKPFTELKGKSAEYYVVITVGPYKRVPFGKADDAETPPRLPYILPHYELHLVPVKDACEHVLGDFQLAVGKLTVQDQKVLLDDDYIPPCCSVGSHNDLLEVHAAIEAFLGKMELYAMQIIQKILQKKQQNEMALIVQKLCEQVCLFTSLHLNEFKQLNQNQPPVCLINTVASFARIIKNTLDFYIGCGKEELVNYCVEWCDVSQGELEGVMVALSNHRYDHLNINHSVEKVSGFAKFISRLFANLAKLEYIGKRKDTGIFVKEEIVIPEQEIQVKKRRSFLAE